jgi:formamidopyrimidine-DNA glycosylase
MPELPEVETIVRQLKSKIVSKEITQVEVFDKMVDAKVKHIAPVKITDIKRRAKYIIISLSNGKYLLVHLGMSGLFHYMEKNKIEERKPIYSKFILASFHLDDGSLLTHNSVRKFGKFDLIDEKELEKLYASLGPEPLEKEFTVQKFAEVLHKKKKSNLKTTLMDQHVISGIGNIYAQEALYYAGINPNRKIDSLSLIEIRKLYDAIIYVLNLGLKYKGASVDDYISVEGEGSFQKHLAVYQQDHCPKKHAITKQALGGRGTSFCKVCQK